MTLLDLVFTLVKIIVVLGFCLGVGGMLTWNDRRMSAMMQDRIGPNRAAIVLPAWLARVLFASPAFLAAAAIAAWAWFGRLPAIPAARSFTEERVLFTLELAVLFTWVGLAVWTALAVRQGPTNATERWLASSVRDPRRVFYGALIAHVVVLIAHVAAQDAESLGGAMPMLGVAAPMLLALVLVTSGVVAALRVPSDGFRLRIAGLLHTAADGLKMIFKEDFIPKKGDRLLHSIAPMLALFPPLVIFAVIPFGDVLCIKTSPEGEPLWNKLVPYMVPGSGQCVDGAPYADGSVSKALTMQVANLDVGILFIFAIAGTGIIGAALAGWASDNKYSLLGGLRAASQMVSYEVTLGLSAVGAFMIYSTLQLDNMVRWQGSNAWGIFVQPIAFFLFFAAATAETKRIPFDLPEGESEIIGYFTEYSGMKFGMFFFAEYIEIVTSSALLVTLFLGGWQLPFLQRDGLVVAIGDLELLRYPIGHLAITGFQVVAFFGKVLAVCWVQAVIRWTLPRFRYDQLMKLGWRLILPLSLANIAVTGVFVLAIDNASPMIQSALGILGDLTQAFVALATLAATIALVLYVLKPTTKKRSVLSSSAVMVQKQGGTRTAPMQA